MWDKRRIYLFCLNKILFFLVFYSMIHLSEFYSTIHLSETPKLLNYTLKVKLKFHVIYMIYLYIFYCMIYDLLYKLVYKLFSDLSKLNIKLKQIEQRVVHKKYFPSLKKRASRRTTLKTDDIRKNSLCKQQPTNIFLLLIVIIIQFSREI